MSSISSATSIFSMAKRVVTRLEKYVFDRVWNEPYSEYRTNTRPKILNKSITAVVGKDTDGQEISGTVYQASSGILSGSFEQIALPSSDSYYVYSIERNQFRPIKLNATEWISLEEYCNDNLVDVRIYSDEGVFLWRAGIYIKQAKNASSILVAVDATMLHRCLDTYTTNADGTRSVSHIADPTRVYFTKYFDSDLVADDVLTCSRVDLYAINRIKSYRADPFESTKIIGFRNGRVVSGDYLSSLESGDYIESLSDSDILYQTEIDRSDTAAPIYQLDTTKKRLLIHTPKAVNPDNYLITYNTCDLYLIPTALTEGAISNGLTKETAGVLVHMCDRADNFHQLTHNDFSVDLDLLDSIALKAGFVDKKYKVIAQIRHHAKKLGLVRDANYCDLLYSYSHTDDDILGFLLDRSDKNFATKTSSTNQYPITFWSAAYLEQNSVYARAMISRNGPTSPNSEDGYERLTVDREYKSGKDYLRSNMPDPPGTYIDQGTVFNSPIVEGVAKYDYVKATSREITDAVAGESVALDAMERVLYKGTTITPSNQCTNCKLYSVCQRHTANAKVTDYNCPDFSHRSISDYVKIFGYYNMLSLICKRVTTYLVTNAKRERLKEVSGTSDNPTYVFKDVSRQFPVHVPLALFDLGYDEWYPLVYVNGVKVDNSIVQVTSDYYEAPYGLEEIHWTYTPTFDEDIFWETEQRRLLVEITDESFEINDGDYVTIELIPRPKEYTYTEATTYETGKSYFVLQDGTYVSAGTISAFAPGTTYYTRTQNEVIGTSEARFVLDETEDDLTSQVGKMAFEPLGSNMQLNRKNSELLFLNGRQLTADMDYYQFSLYPAGDFKPIVQNVSYLTDDTDADGNKIPNLLEATTTTDSVIGNTKGFLIGNEIEWDGVAPFWFDNLSILTVGGKVCSNFTYKYSKLELNDAEHDNGEPWMVRTLVPTKVLELLANSEAQTADNVRHAALRNYFENLVPHNPYRALIPYEHKVYSVYLLAIIRDFMSGKLYEIDVDTRTAAEHDAGDIGFKMLADPVAFRAQFAAYEPYKQYDVVYNREHGLTVDNFRFVDAYPIYHNLQVGERYWRRRISYIVEMLMPTDVNDTIRHREHINGK